VLIKFCKKIGDMRKVILDIEENRYRLLLQFLETLDYVKVVESTPVAPKNNDLPEGQLARLQQRLNSLSTPLFQQISDPVAWQKQQRDEWS
jgi:hypothetical protein